MTLPTVPWRTPVILPTISAMVKRVRDREESEGQGVIRERTEDEKVEARSNHE